MGNRHLTSIPLETTLHPPCGGVMRISTAAIKVIVEQLQLILQLLGDIQDGELDSSPSVRNTQLQRIIDDVVRIQDELRQAGILINLRVLQEQFDSAPAADHVTLLIGRIDDVNKFLQRIVDQVVGIPGEIPQGAAAATRRADPVTPSPNKRKRVDNDDDDDDDGGAARMPPTSLLPTTTTTTFPRRSSIDDLLDAAGQVSDENGCTLTPAPTNTSTTNVNENGNNGNDGTLRGDEDDDVNHNDDDNAPITEAGGTTDADDDDDGNLFDDDDGPIFDYDEDNDDVNHNDDDNAPITEAGGTTDVDTLHSDDDDDDEHHNDDDTPISIPDNGGPTDEELCQTEDGRNFAEWRRKKMAQIKRKQNRLHHLNVLTSETIRATRSNFDPAKSKEQPKPKPRFKMTHIRRAACMIEIDELKKEIAALVKETLFTLHSIRMDDPKSIMTVIKEPVPCNNPPDAGGYVEMIHKEGWAASTPGGNCSIDAVNTAIGIRNFITVKQIDTQQTRTVHLVNQALSKRFSARYSLIKKFGPRRIKSFHQLIQLKDGMYVVVVSVPNGTTDSTIGHAICYNASANYIADGSFREMTGINDNDRAKDSKEINQFFIKKGYIEITNVYQLKVKLIDVVKGRVPNCIHIRNPHYTKKLM